MTDNKNKTSLTHETVLYVNLKTLEDNFNYLKGLLNPSTKTVAVIKAYAYGLGDIEIAKKLESLNVDYFWVADFEEGVTLRKAGIKKPIIIANPGYKSFEKIIEYNLEPVIYNFKLLKIYGDLNVPVHLKFNTGMNRFGFDEEDLPGLIESLKQLPKLKIESVCSHLSSSNLKENDAFSQLQMALFEKLHSSIEDVLDKKFPAHILNSNGVLRFSNTEEEMVRLGIAMYGISKDKNLKQISSLKSTISQIRIIKKGEFVGYSNSFRAKKEIKIAIVPIGYADGLNRRLGEGSGKVLIQNKECPILGQISMDSLVADVSGLSVKEGESVIIFSPKFSIVNIADELNTIPYEIMATLNRRIKRVYFEE
jgi:Alr-MurF fusion protein